MDKSTYKGQGVNCSKNTDCECSLCMMCKAAVDALGNALLMICENQIKEHYNFLVVNVDSLFDAAKECLEQDERAVH